MPSNDPATNSDHGSHSSGIIFWVLLGVVSCALIAYVRLGTGEPVQVVGDRESREVANREREPAVSNRERVREQRTKDPRRIQQMNVMAWWDAVPELVKQNSVSEATSNIHPADYGAPQDCKKCHEDNYASWSEHPHRWMNTLAAEATVIGDFSGQSGISYYGGTANFLKDADSYLMHLQRGKLERKYQITQTIGSRFFQYYIGKQIDGPEPAGHPYYEKDHVLPFGYWLEPKEWVPVVHVGDELPDHERPDPFEAPEDAFYQYSRKCNFCHTTFAVGDMLSRQPGFVGFSSPKPLHWNLSEYLQDAHPELMPGHMHAADLSDDELMHLMEEVKEMEAPIHAVTLGVSCGACHFGAKEHVASAGKVPPKFFPNSPHLHVQVAERDTQIDQGRTHANVNWACGRCHIGFRPEYAAGMSTWNSVEFADAMRGACYSQLRCIDCHNPHRRIGTKDSPNWSHSASFDDDKCLHCHEKYRPPQARVAHTHHPIGSQGSRCMDCHMPRINEGLQDVVRTHAIFSPTKADMIESNHPNACNMCHTDQSIDWTLGHLKEWYGASYSESKIAANYPMRDKSAAVGWLNSDNEAVRLVGADALIRTRNEESLSDILGALDDPFLINRQFASRGLSKWLDVKFADFGYRFYMHPQERQDSLEKIRAQLLSTDKK